MSELREGSQVPTLTRRQFLVAGTGALGGVALAACGSSSAPPSAAITGVAHYRSRPDLTPSLFSITGPAGLPARGFLFVNPTGPVMIDDDGEAVWVREVPIASTNLRVQQYQGKPVLTWWQGKIAPYGVGITGEYLMLDTSYREVLRVKAQQGLQADLHEFIINDAGIAYFTAYRTFSTDLRSIGGPRRGPALDATIQGVDLATGQLVFDWHSAEHIELAESYSRYGPSVPFDPVHVNSIDPTTDGKLIVSARNTWTIYKIDLATGDIIWHLGGKKNDFEHGPDLHFAWQHDARGHPNNVITVFDDEGDPPEAKQSRGLVLEVDETAMTAKVLKAYTHPSKPLLAASQGSVQILPNGDVLVGWGAEPYFTEYRADGTMVMDGRFEYHQSYRTLRFPWTGTPTETPAIAAQRQPGGHSAVYASWNGSTETASWDVFGGPTPKELSLMGSAPKTGFETTIRVEGEPAYVSARAVDSEGRVLATSAVISTPRSA